MAKVAVIFGGRSVEHRVSVLSGRTVAQGLRDAGHDVVGLGIAADGCFVSPQIAQAALAGDLDVLAPQGQTIASTLAQLVALDVDVVFPVVHGTYGEDGALQGLCEMLGLAYVGANIAASAVAMDKALCKEALKAAGIPVVEHILLRRSAFEEDSVAALEPLRGLEFPRFVKPSVGGSSVGCHLVQDFADLQSAVVDAFLFSEFVLVERAVRARELECAVLGASPLEVAQVVGEVVPAADFYDYQDKYIDDAATLVAPAKIPDALRDQMRALAAQAFLAIGGDGMARVDFFLEGDKLLLNEINTLPGFTRISMYPRLWDLSGVSLGTLCGRLVDVALSRQRSRIRLDAGIREFVESF